MHLCVHIYLVYRLQCLSIKYQREARSEKVTRNRIVLLLWDDDMISGCWREHTVLFKGAKWWILMDRSNKCSSQNKVLPKCARSKLSVLLRFAFTGATASDGGRTSFSWSLSAIKARIEILIYKRTAPGVQNKMNKDSIPTLMKL